MKSRRLSGLILGVMLLGLGALFAAGCTETKYVTVDGKPVAMSSDYIQAVDLLPPGATNVVELGNRYFTFELDGQKYLFSWWYGSHGEKARAFVLLTKPCSCGKLCAEKEVSDGPGLVE